MAQDSDVDNARTASVTTSGGTYRAMVSGDRVAWHCPHVHFTQQSARSCADQRVVKLAKAATASATASGLLADGSRTRTEHEPPANVARQSHPLTERGATL